jgi:hypothetical protein
VDEGRGRCAGYGVAGPAGFLRFLFVLTGEGNAAAGLSKTAALEKCEGG